METPANPDADVTANAEPTAAIPALTGAIAPPAAELFTPPTVPVLAKPEPERQVLAETSAANPCKHWYQTFRTLQGTS